MEENKTDEVKKLKATIEQYREAMKSTINTMAEDREDAAIKIAKARQGGIWYMFWWYSAINITVSVAFYLIQHL